MRTLVLVTALLLVPACREETAAVPEPVRMTDEALGHYCQMIVVDHPGPKAQVHLAGLAEPLFFSQVRDAIAFLRMPEQERAVTTVYVSDMGAAAGWEQPGIDNWIPADAAFFLVGSDLTGGMGAPETVPYASVEVAAQAAARHGGTVMRLDTIPTEMVLAPIDILTMGDH
nr:nitrous oxide reductase maturation protein, outer-membrane lipoprotein [uncultured bacterium]